MGRALGSATWHVTPAFPPQPFVLRKRLDVFGHNAPLRSPIAPGRTAAATGPFTLSSRAAQLRRPRRLASRRGRRLVGRAREADLPRAVEGEDASPSCRGRSTRSRARSRGSSSRAARTTTSSTTRCARRPSSRCSEPLALAEAPDDTDVAGDSIDVDVDVSGMRPGRTLLVARHDDGRRGARGSGRRRSASQPVGGAGGSTLAADLAARTSATSVIVHGNVALATHGETVQQLLGSGRASAPFQRFTLAHEPLTYLQSSVDPSGADSALEVRVNDVRWDEVPTLYGAGPRDRAYALRTDEQGKAYVQFGDGEHGARLPVRLEQRAREVPQGHRRRGQREGGRARAAARPAARRQGREQSRARRAAASIRSRRSRRARRSRSACARSAAPSRCSTTRTSRARSAASRRRMPRCCRCAPAGRSSSASRSRAATGSTTSPTRCGRTATRAWRCVVLAGTTQTFRLALKVAVDPALRGGRRARRRRGGAARARTRSTRAPSTEPVFRSEVDRGRAHRRGRARRRRRPALHGRDARRSPTGCSPSGPRSVPAARAIPAGRARCSTPRRSTGWSVT